MLMGDHLPRRPSRKQAAAIRRLLPTSPRPQADEPATPPTPRRPAAPPAPPPTSSGDVLVFFTLPDRPGVLRRLVSWLSGPR